MPLNSSNIAYVRKAMDTVNGANYGRQDLSSLITLTYQPRRPLLQMIPRGPGATNLTHYWNEQAIGAPSGSSASYIEGNKPPNVTSAPSQLYNTTARFGRVAQVTDDESAVFAGAGRWRLADGETERLLVEALDLQIEIQMRGVLNELERCLVQGNAANNSNSPSAPQSQFDGIDINLRGTGGHAAVGAGQVDAVTGALSEAMIRTLAEEVAAKNGAFVPDTLVVSFHDKAIVNQWHASQYVVDKYEALSGGFDVRVYNAGFGNLNVVTEPYMVAGEVYMLNLEEGFARQDLRPLASEPLARISTTVERMVSTTTTLEMRDIQNSTGALTGLSTS